MTHPIVPASIDIACFYLNTALTLAGAVFSFIKLQKDPLNRRWSIYLLVCLGMLLSGIVNGEIVFDLLLKLKHDRYDLYIFAFDKLLGEPSFAMGRLLYRFPWLYISAAVGYKFIYPSMMITISWYFVTQTYEEAVGVSKAIFLSQLVILVYIVIPVSGPVYAFPTFPESISVVPHVISLNAVPNGVPSGHLTIALLVAYFARRWWIGRILGTTNLILTVMATLGSGEHYAFDLLAALPFTIFLLYVSDDAFAAYFETTHNAVQSLDAYFGGRSNMKIKTTAEAFVAALKASVREKKTTVPILSYVKISGNQITGTDLDMFSIVNFDGENSKGNEEFTISPSKAFDMLAREKGPLTIEYYEKKDPTDGQPWATMTIEGVVFKLPTMNVSNFPAVPARAEAALMMDGETFRKLLSRVRFAISNEESRYTLNGSKLIADKNSIKFIATDGHRLSLATAERKPVARAKKNHINTLVSRDALDWLKANVNGSVSLGVKEDDKFAWQTFATGNKTLIVRRLNGQFPDYNAVMPSNNQIIGTIRSAKIFATLLTLVAQCADERSGAVKFHFSKNSTISAQSMETGEASAKIDVPIDGDIDIGLNSRYVLDFLKVVGDAPVTIALRDGQSAVLLSAGDDFKHILMPMRI